MKNLFNSIPGDGAEEVFDQILNSDSVRIERIISRGHTSPANGWFDQEEEEWVMVLQGSGKILFENGQEFLLGAGDNLLISAHQKHKVTWTDPAGVTIWLAVFFRR
ncbi:MAG: cupin domain-containing protein [Lysobacterales bacterium]